MAGLPERAGCHAPEPGYPPPPDPTHPSKSKLPKTTDQHENPPAGSAGQLERLPLPPLRSKANTKADAEREYLLSPQVTESFPRGTSGRMFNGENREE